MSRVRLAVLADSHFHPPGVPSQAAWASDASFGARNAVAVELVRRARPDAVVHVGDVPHPVPGLPEHEPALQVARETYAGLGGVPFFVAPGNHDVGDKPHPWAAAPSVSAAKHAVFERWWGPPWWEARVGELRLVGLDSPVLNSGMPEEQAQWDWLERILVPGGPRTFVFLHYPPFLLDPAEPEHYDNVAEPARGRLLALLRRAGVEAVFAGHVHHPFWNRWEGIDFYVLPSTAFVRPEYAELGRVGPGDEFGRNDTERLGFCLVHVTDDGHDVEWVRTGGAVEPPAPEVTVGDVVPVCPLGLTLRHAWDAVLDLPADGLEPFRRKRVRNDLVFLATLELGAPLLRLPLDDLRSPAAVDRLVRRGGQVVVYTAEPVTDADRRLLDANRGLVRALELVLPRSRVAEPLPEVAVPRWVAAFGRHAAESGKYFSHFAPHGFAPDDPDVDRAGGEGVVFRVDADADLADVVGGLASWSIRAGREAMALVVLFRGGEATDYADDDRVASLVGRAFDAARHYENVVLMLDTTVDQDRGYFPRHGLIDRRGNPRRAFRELVRRSRSNGRAR